MIGLLLAIEIISMAQKETVANDRLPILTIVIYQKGDQQKSQWAASNAPLSSKRDTWSRIGYRSTPPSEREDASVVARHRLPTLADIDNARVGIHLNAVARVGHKVRDNVARHPRGNRVGRLPCVCGCGCGWVGGWV